MPPTAPGAPIPTVSASTPAAPGAPIGTVSPSSPSAPGFTLPGSAFPSDPDAASSVVTGALTTLRFEACVAPELGNAGNLLTVPGLQINGRPVATSSGTSASSLVGLVLHQESPLPGIWCAAYYNNTVWRFDIWWNGELMLYFVSATFAYANPGAVPEWDFSDNPGNYPSEEWNHAQSSKFSLIANNVGYTVLPNYEPTLYEDPLLPRGVVNGKPAWFFGDDLYWDAGAEAWTGYDLAVVWSVDEYDQPGWAFGELGGGATWWWYQDTPLPPLRTVADNQLGGAAGNVRLIPGPLDDPAPAVPTYSPSNPSAPGSVL